MIKPRPIPAAVTGGFTVDDFTVDEQCATVSCPAGYTRPITKTRNVIFGALCRDCPLATGCTTSKTGRTLNPHQRDDLLRAARRDWSAQPDLQDNYRKNRPNVERVVSQIASRGGRRLKLRYRGTTKNHAWLTRRTAGLNLRNPRPWPHPHRRSLGSGTPTGLKVGPTGLRPRPVRATRAPCHGPDRPSPPRSALAGRPHTNSRALARASDQSQNRLVQRPPRFASFSWSPSGCAR